jgi:hypothetical protein
MRRFVRHENTGGRWRSSTSAERRIPLGLAQRASRCRDPATATRFTGSQSPTIRLCFGFRGPISNPTAKSTKTAKRAETEPQGLRADQGCCCWPSAIFRWPWRASATLLRPESLRFFLLCSLRSLRLYPGFCNRLSDFGLPAPPVAAAQARSSRFKVDQAKFSRGILPHANPPRPKPFAWFACFAVRTRPLYEVILPNEPNLP